LVSPPWVRAGAGQDPGWCRPWSGVVPAKVDLLLAKARTSDCHSPNYCRPHTGRTPAARRPHTGRSPNLYWPQPEILLDVARTSVGRRPNFCRSQPEHSPATSQTSATHGLWIPRGSGWILSGSRYGSRVDPGCSRGVRALGPGWCRPRSGVVPAYVPRGSCVPDRHLTGT
jgi:hypothetical protein